MPFSVLYILYLKENEFLTGGEDNLIRLWNINLVEPIIINKHLDKVFYINKTNDGNIISSGLDGIIKIWEIKTGYLIDTIEIIKCLCLIRY